MDKKSFGKRLNKARKERGITGEKLAELCNINSTYLRQIEGGTKIPSLPVFVVICQQLKVSPNYLLSDTLSVNEYTDVEELARLLHSATPKQIKLITTMIKSALEIFEE